MQRDLEELAREGLKTGSPGVAIACLRPEGHIQAAAGVSSLRRGDRLRLDHRFAIGSITKTVVAVVVHQLAAEDVLDLNATPAEYLDDAVIAGVANADRAPLRTMLDHTSGIPSWEFDPDWIRRGRGKRFAPGRPFAKEQTLSYLRGRHPPVNAPGDRYSYSNTNHTLLGLIVERTTGRTFESEARRRVLDPLDLHSFALESFEPIPAGALATPHHLATPTAQRCSFRPPAAAPWWRSASIWVACTPTPTAMRSTRSGSDGSSRMSTPASRNCRRGCGAAYSEST